MPVELYTILVPSIFLIAGAYASVGLGGGSGYVAVMTLVGMPITGIAPTALLLNILVTGAATLRFGLAGRIKRRLFLPFLVPAIPAAFIGGLVKVDEKIFLALMAAALAAAGISMFRSAAGAHETDSVPESSRLYATAIPAGILVGFISGLLGIGGGVFLGPIILLLGWAGPKQVAAMNSVLILVLSTVALAAHGIKGSVEFSIMLPLAIAALLGGLAGASLAEKKLTESSLQRVFAVIVLIAAIKAAMDAIALI